MAGPRHPVLYQINTRIWLRELGVALGRSVTLDDVPEASIDEISADVCGSPFAIHDYVVNREFGGSRALARFRKRLADRGVKLMLDFVPNHTALDHPWVSEHPEFYVHGSDVDLAREATN